MDLNYVRTQVKMAKYGFHYVRLWTPQKTKYGLIVSGQGLNYVQTQVEMVKYGFELCPDTCQNRKIWQLGLMDKFVFYGITI